jgi:hypothetical protein
MLKMFWKLSKNLTPFLLILSANCLSILAQDLEIKIKVIESGRVSVEGKFLADSRTLATRDISFLRNIADVSELGERIENFRVFGKNDHPIEVKKLGAGEYQTTEISNAWNYEVKINPPLKITDSAHISWLLNDLGILMVGDLVPRFNKSVSAKITFEMPIEWRILSSESQIGERQFEVKNISDAIFLVGKDFRERAFQIDKTSLSFAFSGDWQFSDDQALEMARSILTGYQEIFKAIPHQKIQILLLPFPQENPNTDRWRAETRGSTVTIISGVLPFKNLAVQRLHEQLRHEIFHLWMPNGLSLSGNYDWFYEGFTIYHALRTGVELNQIRFDDYLNTLGRAFEMAQILTESQQISLVEAADKRWTGTSNLVYAKGLIVAFLCDLTLLRESKGQRNLQEVFRRIYQKYHLNDQTQDGNSAIIGILRSFPELNLIVQNYIEGKSKIDWQNDLTMIGIEQEKDGFNTRLKVTEKPNSRQKDLLDKLGYNQWRKLLQKTK